MPKPMKFEVGGWVHLAVTILRQDEETVTVEMPNGHRETIRKDSEAIEATSPPPKPGKLFDRPD
jgi:hypothetical protein